MPTVTVLIPNYNRPQMLQDAIRSVLGQTYQDFEILVVDDGSTEDIPAALAPFGDRVRYVRKENGGPALARNLGLDLATGKYIAFIDNDDVWLPRKLERQVEILNSQPEVALVSCQVYVMDENARVWARSPQGSDRQSPLVSMAELVEQNAIVGGGSSAIVRAEVLREIGKFDTNIRFVEDWDCWLRIARKWKVWMVPEPLSYYRINPRGHRNHAPWPHQVEAVHENILHVLERAIENWPLEIGDPARYQARANAREYLRHASVLYAVGRQVEGRKALEKAIAWESDVATNPAMIKSAIFACAAGYAMELPTKEWANRATCILANVMADLPHPVRFLQDQRAHMEAALLAELAFLAAQYGATTEARSFAWQCLSRDIAWAKNIGFIKLLLTGGRQYKPIPVQEHMARLALD